MNGRRCSKNHSAHTSHWDGQVYQLIQKAFDEAGPKKKARKVLSKEKSVLQTAMDDLHCPICESPLRKRETVNDQWRCTATNEDHFGFGAYIINRQTIERNPKRFLSPDAKKALLLADVPQTAVADSALSTGELSRVLMAMVNSQLSDETIRAVVNEIVGVAKADLTELVLEGNESVLDLLSNELNDATPEAQRFVRELRSEADFVREEDLPDMSEYVSDYELTQSLQHGDLDDTFVPRNASALGLLMKDMNDEGTGADYDSLKDEFIKAFGPRVMMYLGEHWDDPMDSEGSEEPTIRERTVSGLSARIDDLEKALSKLSEIPLRSPLEKDAAGPLVTVPEGEEVPEPVSSD